MTTQFEFRLVGVDAPEGQINVDDVVAILQKLQELATKVGRVETDAGERGRPGKKVERVARLRLIGLKPGSTVIEIERVEEQGTLDFHLDHEEGFDARFSEIIEAIGSDVRPPGLSDTIAETAADLVAALQRAAPEVEFRAGGKLRRSFHTAETHRETWRPVSVETASNISVVGRLFAVNLKSHRLQVQDDVGHQFALPNVENDAEVGRLIGSYVAVQGVPERDARGRLTQIHGASIAAAPDAAPPGVPQPVSVSEILSAAPGPEAGGIPGLSDDEANAFFEALRT